MASGPEHYEIAEHMIEGAAHFAKRTEQALADGDNQLLDDLKASIMNSLVSAQVHATLALAAATIAASGPGAAGALDPWREVGAL